MRNMNLEPAPDVLNTSAPGYSSEFAEAVAKNYYGINARANLLTCERDQIFLLTADNQQRYVLRFVNPAEDRQVTHFQTEALLHVARIDPELPLPRVIMSVDNEAEVEIPTDNGQTVVVRMISFLSGVPISKTATRSTEQRQKMGENLARLDLALRGFFHPAAGHEILWDLKRALQLRELLPNINNIEGRVLAEQGLINFERYAIPEMPKLRSQVIHNDLNYCNVMVNESDGSHITGIIDFGDMVHAPLINELGVAASYHLDNPEHALADAAILINAYHKVLPLETAELDILLDLIIGRVVMTIAITETRAKQYPHNRDYIMRNTPSAWWGLRRLSALERAEGTAYLKRACGLVIPC